MVKFSQSDLIKAIIREYKCSEKEANSIANYVENLDDKLQSTLDQWIKNGKVSNFSINDINVQYVMNKMKSAFLESLFILNRLIDPNEAEKFKKTPFIIKDVPIVKNPPKKINL